MAVLNKKYFKLAFKCLLNCESNHFFNFHTPDLEEQIIQIENTVQNKRISDDQNH